MKPETSFTLLSYNIHKGFSVFRGRYLLDSIRAAIEATEADVVCLQEILGFHPPFVADQYRYFEDQLEYLADRLWPHHAYGKNAIYTNGHHGNAILSRFPFRSWENIDISTHRFEKRGLLHVTFEVGEDNTPVHLFCVHLNLLNRCRFKQVNQLIDRANSKVAPQSPLIIAGDFNDWNQKLTQPLYQSHGLMEAFLEVQGQHAKTFPAPLPMMTLDRVYSRGFVVESAEVLRGFHKLSDHLPLKVVLRRAV